MPNGRVLLTGGEENSDGSVPPEEEYNPATGTWSVVGSMLQPRHGHEAVLLSNGKVLVIGGLLSTSTFPPTSASTVFTQTTELHDPATRTWSLTDELPEPNTYGTVTRLVTGQVLLAWGDFAHETEGRHSRALLYTP